MVHESAGIVFTIILGTVLHFTLIGWAVDQPRAYFQQGERRRIGTPEIAVIMQSLVRKCGSDNVEIQRGFLCS
jgi:hypothetical protein